MTVTIGGITLDGSLSDWNASELAQTPANTVSGYSVYGTYVTDPTYGVNYIIGINGGTTGTNIGAGTTIYLNTDQNAATGGELSWANVGYEYYVQWMVPSGGTTAQPFLYNSSGTQLSTTPLNYGVSGGSLEVAIPQSSLFPTGGTAPTNINFIASINGTTYLPGDVANNPQYTITDPATLVTENHAVKKIAIVYSAETAAIYDAGATDPSGAVIPQANLTTAYNDLFMTAQHEAEAAGVSYDILTADQLATMTAGQLAQYSAIVIPDMQNVQASQASAIESVLHQAVYNYKIPLITSGDFMTNDQTGALLSSPYGAMQDLFGVTLGGYGTSTYSVSVAPGATTNPIMAGYPASELIGGANGQFDIPGTTTVETPGYYYNTGYQYFTGYNGTATTALANINLTTAAGAPTTSSVAGVIQATTGGTNTVFATNGLMGDSNLLQNVIQNAVYGTAPSLSLDITRFKGVVDSRTDMDQSQFPADITPTNPTTGAAEPGIYDEMIPILQQLKSQYDFVGSYYVNVGDGSAGTDNPNSLALTTPYLKEILQMGGEIGSHSTNHLITPPTVDANGNPVPINSTTGVSTWSENTNTLYLTPPANGSAPNWTYAYEFGQSNTLIDQALGITVAGAAVPGANDTSATSLNILPYYPSSSSTGIEGYVNGGWTGAGSGSPNAFGYISPTDTNSEYIAPNITFDFSEVQYDAKTPTVSLQDWENLFNQVSANSQSPVIVWPWHDYGLTDWNTTTNQPNAGIYSTAMFTSFIQYAYNAGYEFVTSEDLAARMAAQQRATITETNPTANTINVTVTPGQTTDDLGTMALNAVNGGSNVIQNAGNWYAYDSNSVFMAKSGVSNVTVTLGTTQDDVTHIASLPMRADLQSVTGDGTNLSYSANGDGSTLIDLKTPGTNIVSISQNVALQGVATALPSNDLTATLAAAVSGGSLNQLTLNFTDPALTVSSSSPQGVPLTHNVSITEGTTAVENGNDIIFGGTGNDVIPVALNDTINGEAGTNTAKFTGLVSNYKFTLNADGSITAVDQRTSTTAGYDGTDTLVNMQNFQFSDGLVLTQAQLLSAAVAVSSVTTSPAKGTDLGAGKTVTIKLNLAQAVNVTGVPTLTLNDGGAATYTSGSGTKALTFTYTVAAGQNTTALAITGMNLPSGAAITTTTGATTYLTGTDVSLGQIIDTTSPTITKVTSSPSTGSATTGSTVAITLTTSEAVNVATGTTLLLSDGGTATYAKGSGTTSIVFNYSVARNQSTKSLSIIGIEEPSSTAVQDLAGNTPTSLSAAGVNLGIGINPTGTATSPAAISISGTQDAEVFGASSQAVTFGSGATGTLALDAPSSYTGKISGITTKDILDLTNWAFGSTTASYSGSSTAGTLTLHNGAQTATLSLTGTGLTTPITLANDGHGGTALHI